MSHQRPVNVPDDVLLIHYPSLIRDASPHARLAILAAIGRLLNQRETICSVQGLSQDRQVLLSLKQWLMGEEGGRFWQIEGDRVIPLRMCEKHILIGTRQLLDDLSALAISPERFHLADLDALWQAADDFVHQRVKTE